MATYSCFALFSVNIISNMKRLQLWSPTRKGFLGVRGESFLWNNSLFTLFVFALLSCVVVIATIIGLLLPGLITYCICQVCLYVVHVFTLIVLLNGYFMLLYLYRLNICWFLMCQCWCLPKDGKGMSYNMWYLCSIFCIPFFLFL